MPFNHHWHRQAEDFVYIIGFSEPNEVPIIKTVCGLHVPQSRITESKPTKNDMAINPDLWCPGCFDGQS